MLEEAYRYYCEELPLTTATYVHHLFFEHVVETRRKTGPLYKTSCAIFEGNYRHLKKGFYPGTQNIGVQGIRNTLLHQLHTHMCPSERKLRLSAKTTRTIDDSLVYCSNDRYYKILEESEESGMYKAARIKTRKFRHPLIRTPFDLPWSLVGVKKYYGLRDDVQEISREDVQGKLILMPGNVLAEYPKSWLLESYL